MVYIALVLLLLAPIANAAPLVPRGETGQGQSQPFWISVVAVVAILVTVIVSVVVIYCVKARRRRRRRTITDKGQQQCDSPLSNTSQQPIVAGRTDEVPSSIHVENVSSTSDPDAKRNRLSALFFGQPPPVPPSSSNEKSITLEQDAKHSIRKKKKNLAGTWTSAAFASLGRKSVASVQWVGFRGSMDHRPQSDQLFVVNNHDDDSNTAANHHFRQY
ncbi:hypothetical protein BJV82DRAFT_592286 [Fennellomyces sp. T-0311]|nr:hypothetical protein BJV82DRAFT_592286 [Fennellomyces sp. T-0311]